MQYVGGQEVFGFKLLASNISIASQRAFAVHNDVVYWMGTDKFYQYDGRVTELESPIADYVFGNLTTFTTVFAGLNMAFNEVIWFYPSAAGGTAYALYNYEEKSWAPGVRERTMWYDTAALFFPLAANGNQLLEQESGVDADDGAGAYGIEAHIESADMDINDGETFSFVRRILPDVNFTGSGANASVDVQLIPRRAPGANVGTASTGTGPATMVGGTVTPYTERIDIRLRARQVRLRVSSSAMGTTWTLGTQRIDAQEDGQQ
jgi:hypothetical protein